MPIANNAASILILSALRRKVQSKSFHKEFKTFLIVASDQFVENRFNSRRRQVAATRHGASQRTAGLIWKPWLRFNKLSDTLSICHARERSFHSFDYFSQRRRTKDRDGYYHEARYLVLAKREQRRARR